jgi:hypothetical protein
MKQMLVRYKTKPDTTEENAHLIEQVFKELRAGQPKDLRYLVLRLDDGSFLHFAMHETDGDVSPLRQVEAFRAFQSGIKERLVDGPYSTGVTIVGSYRMLDNGPKDGRPDAA